jgi:hypothetical protein
VRALPIVVFALVGSLVVVACSGDDSNSGGSGSGPPPSNCTEPCSPVGSVCFGPVEPNCNGSWYCWSDTDWHCAPEEAGGPPDATLFEANPGDDGPDEVGPTETGPTETGPAETGPETGPESGPVEAGPG